jgi:hypothetical protein
MKVPYANSHRVDVTIELNVRVIHDQSNKKILFPPPKLNLGNAGL